MKQIILFIIILLLISCSSEIVLVKQPALKKMGIEPLPCWVYELPAESDYIIGVSARSFDHDSMFDAARQMAAVMKSRNKGSFTIDRFSISSGSNILREGKAVFQLNVAEPNETLRIYESLNLIDETYLYDHYIALFSETELSIPESFCQKKIINFPDWYSKDEIIIEDEYLLSHAQDGSYNLVTAWEKTAEKARYELAKYLEKEVKSIVLSQNENIEKNIAVESTKKLVNLEITRTFIIMKNYDSLISYQVYLEIKMKK